MIEPKNIQLLDMLAEKFETDKNELINVAVAEYIQKHIALGDLRVNDYRAQHFSKGRFLSDTVLMFRNIKVGQTVSLPMSEFKGVYVRAKRQGIKIRTTACGDMFYATRIS
jgi:hypothetical protein